VIESVTLAMGSKWSPNTSLDVGIDGSIEFFDPGTGRSIGRVVAVQSKVHNGKLPAETPESFTWAVKPADLDYWMGLNVPVLLIVVRPPFEAYWIPIQEAFADPAIRKSRRVSVSKAEQTFDAGAMSRLIARVAPRSLAALTQTPREEELSSNLIPLTVPDRLMLGDASESRAAEVGAALRRQGARDQAWVLQEGRILTFHDLSAPTWASHVDRGTVEEFDTADWAGSADDDKTRLFAWLLNNTLRMQLGPEVRFWKSEHAFGFRAGERTLVGGELRDWKIIDRSTGRGRTVFTSWRAQKDRHRIAYRHLAAEMSFLRYEGTWYLSIVPTYVFTRDGWEVSVFQASGTAAMKRLERNETVRGLVRFWSNYVAREPDLAGQASILRFGQPRTFHVDAGIDEESWLARTPETSDDHGLWADGDGE